MANLNSFTEFEDHLTQLGYIIELNQDLIPQSNVDVHNTNMYVLYYQDSPYLLDNPPKYYSELKFEKYIAYNQQDIITALEVLDGSMPESLFLFDQNQQLDHKEFIIAGTIAPQHIHDPQMLIDYNNASLY